MYNTGLVSISFRSLSPSVIIDGAKKAGLDGIEWGSDVHVPVGDIATAAKVRELTNKAGLKVLAYGSYFHVGRDSVASFDKVLMSAKELGAPIIRIWAYNKGSADVTKQEFSHIVSDCREIADMVLNAGITLSFECHVNTYTDDYRAALELIRAIDRENVKMFWQPNQFHDEAYNIEAAKTLAPYTTNIHTFYWDAKNRYPLSDGREIWAKYIECFKDSRESSHAFLLEFMHDDSIESLADTAATLKSLLAY